MEWLAPLMVVVLAVVGAIAGFYLVTRVRTVPEGHVAIIERFDKFGRTAGPGLYMLRPLEEEVARLYVRQREATAVVPNVFTEGGLAVTVNLRYSYSLDPSLMNRSEIYYSDEDRDEQLRTLFKRVFQDLMHQLSLLPSSAESAPVAGEHRDRVNIERLFSPFAGRKARLVQTELERAVRTALRPHGYIVTDAPVLIYGLTLPPEISAPLVGLAEASLMERSGGNLEQAKRYWLDDRELYYQFVPEIAKQIELLLDTSERSAQHPTSLLEVARTYLPKAGFELQSSQDPTFFLCAPNNEMWKNHLKIRVPCKVLTGISLDSDMVLELIRTARGLLGDQPEWILVVCDRAPTISAWYQVAAQRESGILVMPVDNSVLIAGWQKKRYQDELLDYLKERFLGDQRDLYDRSTPLADSLSFFGREKLAERLIGDLLQGNALALFGIRKMGKSCLLNYIQNKLPCPAALVDLQAGVELNGVYRRILVEWSRSLHNKTQDIDWTPPDIIESADPTIQFTTAALNLLEIFEHKAVQPRLVILVDEIDRILPRDPQDTHTLNLFLAIAGALRGLVQERIGCIGLMVVGVDPAVVRVNRFSGHQNPFWSFFREEYLPPLYLNDCRQMIENIGGQMGLRFSPDAADFVAQTSGGHPYWARKLCSLASRAWTGQGEIDLGHIKASADRFVTDPSINFLLNESGLWGEITDPNVWSPMQVKANETILVTLAGEECVRMEDLVSGETDQRSTYVTSLHELEHRAIIHKRHNEFSIRLQLFRKWIRAERMGKE